MSQAALPAPLAELIADFQELGQNDRLQLLLELSDELPDLPDRYADHPELLEPVPECQSPLFLTVELAPDSTVSLFFSAPPEAPTTRDRKSTRLHSSHVASSYAVFCLQ